MLTKALVKRTADFPRFEKLAFSAVALCSACFAASFPSNPAFAQEMVSRPVVQSLGSEEVQDLGAALRQLARRPRDLGALLAAGKASLAVNDLDAAMGFFGRAEEVAPQDARVKFGIASVFLQSGRPVQALRLFNQIAASGSASGDPSLARDRGLAFDLVGDFENAQKGYVAALAIDADDQETVRRLAISQAISGDSAGFEETLRPLLASSDPAAFRSRAFGLAILGEQSRAAAIVNEVMPRDLASRLTPYLAYMPRLTRAQQAAAANLGIFPRAADIGREDPEIAQYRAGGSGAIAAVGAAPSSPVSGADAKLAPAGTPLGSRPSGQPAIAAALPTASVSSETKREGQPKPLQQTGPTVVYSSDTTTASQTGAALQPQPDAKPPEPKPNVADAFADLDRTSATRVATADAVDLNTINIPREANEPPVPVAPRRFWVQVATGRDVSRLKFDWRRIKRQGAEILAPFEAHITPWGEANRLLAGPVESAVKAREMVNDLKAKGLDTFTFTSPEGAEVKAVD